MPRTLQPPRLLVTPRHDAMRAGRCVLRVEVELPLGFHALPVPAQREEIEAALARAARVVTLGERQTA